MAGDLLAIDGELVIGRGQGGVGDLGGDAELSRRHARIERTDRGHLLIEDLGSTNGTRVNGDRITAPTVLGPGDRIELGATELEVLGDDHATLPRAHGTERTQVAASGPVPAPVSPLAPNAPPPPRSPGGPVHPSVDRKPWRLGRVLVVVVGALVIAAIIVVLIAIIGGR
jgi:hypothetical protein